MKLIEYRGGVLSGYVPDRPRRPRGTAKGCAFLNAENQQKGLRIC